MEGANRQDANAKEMHLAQGRSAGNLSPREVEVLRMTSLGLTNPEIAERLEVTVHAVKFHLASVYRKLGVSNRTEAAVTYLSTAGGLGGASVVD